jgi:hypothetical protein
MVAGVLCFGLAVYLVIAVVMARKNYVHGRGFTEPRFLASESCMVGFGWPFLVLVLMLVKPCVCLVWISEKIGWVVTLGLHEKKDR